MHLIRTGLLVLTCLAIFGCKKTGETDAVATAPPTPANTAPNGETRATAPALTDKRPIIVIFGDSLSEVGVESSASYPDVLQRTLDAKGYQYRIVNQGISGDTTTDGVGRTQAAIDLKPEMVLLELGGNDGLRGIPVASSKANLETMIEQFQKDGVGVILAGKW